MGVPEFDDNNFDSEVLKATGPVLVDFWRRGADLAADPPVIEQLAGENQADQDRQTERRQRPSCGTSYGVSSIPTLMIFKNGEVVDRFVGVQPKSRLQQAIDASKA